MKQYIITFKENTPSSILDTFKTQITALGISFSSFSKIYMKKVVQLYPFMNLFLE